jgi:uncharacterized membrane protein HdeD (DUF308 family)
MSQQMQQDPADMLTAVGRHWGWVLAFGILTLIAGIATVAWPSRTVLIIAVIFGVELFVAGIFRLVAAFTSAGEGHRVMFALLGVISIIVGIFCLRHIFQTVAILALILGVYWIISGVIDIFSGIFSKGAPNRGWNIFIGLLAMIAGIVVLVQPAISLATLAWVLGVWLIVFGAMETFASFQLRKAASSAGHSPAAAAA